MLKFIIGGSVVKEFVNKINNKEYISNYLFEYIKDNNSEVIPNNFDIDKYNSDILDKILDEGREFTREIARNKFIDMKNLQSMADCVKEVIERYDSSDIQKQLNDNYEYALANHTWEMRGQEIIDFYESIYGK